MRAPSFHLIVWTDAPASLAPLAMIRQSRTFRTRRCFQMILLLIRFFMTGMWSSHGIVMARLGLDSQTSLTLTARIRICKRVASASCSITAAPPICWASLPPCCRIMGWLMRRTSSCMAAARAASARSILDISSKKWFPLAWPSPSLQTAAWKVPPTSPGPSTTRRRSARPSRAPCTVPSLGSAGGSKQARPTLQCWRLSRNMMVPIRSRRVILLQDVHCPATSALTPSVGRRMPQSRRSARTSSLPRLRWITHLQPGCGARAPPTGWPSAASPYSSSIPWTTTTRSRGPVPRIWRSASRTSAAGTTVPC
mmetsp:Transcript_31747/g.84513  ORF Transcript_31747/g.84513 Transcript_31747/m.84513 type:complete len:310 (+) Transcript_31747:1242-2171(+)